MLEVRVFNTGSETETFSLQINSDATSPVSLMLESASSVSVAADASAVWTLKATASEGSLGLLERIVTVTHDSLASQDLTLQFDVQEQASLNLMGPLDGRIVVQSGEDASVMLTIENDGTSSITLDTFTISDSLVALMHNYRMWMGISSNLEPHTTFHSMFQHPLLRVLVRTR